MKYIPPSCPEKGFSFVAAATLYRNFGGYSVYVKYKGGDPHKITIKQNTHDYIWLICPDRELVIVRNNQELGAFYPYGDSFDEVVDFNLFNDHVCKNLGIEYIMTNYAHSTTSKNSRLGASLPPDKRIQVLSDSGGLQLARGVKNMIHPATLMEFYNNNADAGMVLDLPLFFSDPAIAKEAAYVQRANIEAMLKVSKGVELINIFHGQSPEERAMFREIVETPEIPRVAIGGIATYLPVSAVNAIYSTLMGKQKYKQYHVLGIYTAEMVPLMVKLANVTGAHITCDSSSHLQSAANKAYHFQFDIYHKLWEYRPTNMKRIPIGTRASQINTKRYLPCQCKVCTTLKYMDILGFGDNRHTTELLSIHNAIEMTRYAKSLEELCQHSTPREYNKMVEHQLKSRTSNFLELQGALEFTDMIRDHGIKAARKKYSSYIGRRKIIGDRESPGLFGSQGQEIYEDKVKASIVAQLKVMKRQLKENPV